MRGSGGGGKVFCVAEAKGRLGIAYHTFFFNFVFIFTAHPNANG